MKTILIVLIPLLLLAGCSMQKGIVYKVSGSASSANLTYENSSGGTSQVSGVVLPWETGFSVTPTSSKMTFLYISAQNATATGSVTVEIFVDGKQVKTSTSTGAYVIATASDSLGGY